MKTIATATHRRRLGGTLKRAAALCLLALAALWCQAQEARAQWATAGTSTTTTNSVGIGTTTPQTSLVVTTGTTNVTRGIINEQTSNDGNSALFTFSKSRAGGAVLNGDNIGSLFASAFDGSALQNPTRMRFFVDGPVAVGSVPTAIQFITGSNGVGTERLRISSAGSVGIATANPLAPIHVATATASGGVAFFQKDSASNGIGIGTYNGLGAISGVNSTYTAASNLLINPTGGNVGIGTSNPGSQLHVYNSQNTEVIGMVENANAGATAAASIEAKTDNGYAYLKMGSTAYGSWGAVGTTGTGSFYYDVFNGAGDHVWRTTASATERMRITNAGNVGIGTNAPASKLHVVGDITVTGNINAKYQDVAEWVPATEHLAAGTVVVLDTQHANHVNASTKAYDTRAAGVISAQPGLTLGEGGEGKALVATTGRVKVRVDATRAPIGIGDLLVTSDTPGVAMKSEPVNVGGVSIHRPGTIIGKALEPLAGGTGEILVLLSLQ